MSSSTLEGVENDPRYTMGRKAGQFDRGAEIISDAAWFEETGFDLKDPTYVSGYNLGYQEGPQEKKKKKG